MQVMGSGKFVTRFDGLVGLFTTNLFSKHRLAIVSIVSFLVS